jgi:hypothetical protein
MRVTPSGTRAVIIFATHRGQPAMQINGVETSPNQIAKFGLDWEWYLRSSAPCGWGTMSLAPEDLATAGETITGRELAPPTFALSIAPPAPPYRGCGSYTRRRATSQKPPLTSS